MSIYRKTLILYFCFLIPAILLIMLFSFQTENPLRTYLVIAGSFVLGDILFLKIKTRIFRYFYKKYTNILEEELEPEKFIKLTENEYNSVKNKKYRHYMKMNFFLGYFARGEIAKAYDYLTDVEISGVTAIAEADKVIYYYNLMLALYNLNRKDETAEIYSKCREIYENEFKYKNKRIEMENLIKYLELLLFKEEKYEEIIEILERTLRMKVSKRLELSLKYDLASIKEKAGKIQEAENLYREVAQKGNKLYIREKSERELKKFIK
ncbi:hypothetical protein EII29_03700 [Leptotrichia sp. OH3620_COT-345]|uniref:hypothetical protein n=1 Tax=Leptotrichia sp. OH3620_COT-345 TaxID=2491048 RepID=UPI000F646C5D|nr:hypothetical protein [Leptotrichia sp. OH3620_COT-345]RRD40216.1 hypothetical protein EII29_03700 [Leptotrichia sp. OH3620_COT-345]